MRLNMSIYILANCVQFVQFVHSITVSYEFHFNVSWINPIQFYLI